MSARGGARVEEPDGGSRSTPMVKLTFPPKTELSRESGADLDFQDILVRWRKSLPTFSEVPSVRFSDGWGLRWGTTGRLSTTRSRAGGTVADFASYGSWEGLDSVTKTLLRCSIQCPQGKLVSENLFSRLVGPETDLFS